MSHTLTQMTTSYPPTVTAEMREGAMFVELVRDDGPSTSRVVLSGPPEDVAVLCRKIATYAEIVASVGAEPGELDVDAAAADTGALA